MLDVAILRITCAGMSIFTAINSLNASSRATSGVALSLTWGIGENIRVRFADYGLWSMVAGKVVLVGVGTWAIVGVGGT